MDADPDKLNRKEDVGALVKRQTRRALMAWDATSIRHLGSNGSRPKSAVSRGTARRQAAK